MKKKVNIVHDICFCVRLLAQSQVINVWFSIKNSNWLPSKWVEIICQHCDIGQETSLTIGFLYDYMFSASLYFAIKFLNRQITLIDSKPNYYTIRWNVRYLIKIRSLFSIWHLLKMYYRTINLPWISEVKKPVTNLLDNYFHFLNRKNPCNHLICLSFGRKINLSKHSQENPLSRKKWYSFHILFEQRTMFIKNVSRNNSPRM